MKLILNKLQSVIYYLILLFLPTQLGKHFWPDFSYVQGVRVDYLSPTLYVTDILIFLLFLIFGINIFLINKFKIQNSKCKIQNAKLHVILVSLFLLVIIVGIIFSKNPAAGIYGFIKLVEFSFFGYYTARFIRNISDIKKISLILAFGVISESLLAFAEYFTQGSIGSIFYFFGERAFTSQTPGIANASLNGELILRPYATFSHPNVLAGYLIIALAIVIFNFQSASRRTIFNFKKIIMGISLVLGSVALFLTMSRIAIVLWVFMLTILLFRYISNIQFQIPTPVKQASSFIRSNFQYPILQILNTKTRRLFVVFVFIGSICSIIVLSPIHFRFTNFNLSDESVVVRNELMNDSLQMIKENFTLGVGLNNFLPSLPHYQKITSKVFYLQPAHNIYLLIFSQIGIVGFSFFSILIIKTFQNLKLSRYAESCSAGQLSTLNSQFSILMIVLVLGFFDHYFLTIQQGQLLFSFVLGMCWANR